MKAMLLKTIGPIESNPLEMAEISMPEPNMREIHIKINACGICHTDLHIIEGEIPLPKSPLVIGHQIVGIVEKIGSGVTRFKKGDVVGVPWLNSTCGKCRYCLIGNENLCDKALFTGYNVDGGYAQYVVVSEDFAYHIPSTFSYVEAAPLLCAGVIGFRALRLSDLENGERLGLFGFGQSAHIVIQIARYWNCEVFVFTRSKEHQQLAKKLGAIWVGTVDEKPPTEVDRAILFAPAGRLVHNALQVLRKGGTLSIGAIYLTLIPEMDYSRLLYGEKTVRSVTASTRKDAEALLKLAGEIPIKTEVQTFPLEKANQALQLLKQGTIRGAGVLEIKN